MATLPKAPTPTGLRLGAFVLFASVSPPGAATLDIAANLWTIARQPWFEPNGVRPLQERRQQNRRQQTVPMDISRIPIGANPPHEVNVIIEIPQGGTPVKYEIDKKSGAMFVDRFLHTAMFYPANYGFIPHTLSEDGDPLDCMVLSHTPVTPCVVIPARPIGALLMEDEHGIDEKIIAVPLDKLHPFYTRVASYRDLPEIFVQTIAHFFEHYKDLEEGKWVKLIRWAEPTEAADLIRSGIERGKKTTG
ncbi:Inorganic pyrophosphatase [Methylacidimicrobium tartarophylax]|uniref:Inorganic pyrophosphatase n=2 Tax=Methylacidimicrobium tartarophylax TaxID=1041768 RepID=A0A5E6MBG8_9BACT|nr:Inorganic pyrophosphatase [Methylacidimicrobium tartarophylax]